ncbi:hypothetical protein QIS99_28225 [Streptomyces sp. B-S-A8]|uniref:Flp family type IVb pilin n=1 Tax=Streptomyces solicavernae TaxID=3043614 RepID=A0ABT6S025_9ACTN|nr:hypothetical protein [Streptomyces sp. B-S-A8]MDI3390049.1 hypothetical protein [Streptomyces sp. B-S-A8]
MHPTDFVRRAGQRLHVALTTRINSITAKTREDTGAMSTLEALGIGIVVMAGVATFVLAWNGALEGLVADFKSAVGK